MKCKPRRIAALLAMTLLSAALPTLAASEALAATALGIAGGGASETAPSAVKAELANAIARQAALHWDAAGRHICYAAHVQNIGWQQPVCDGAVAGTTGQGLRMEALDIVVSGVGGVCAAAHVQNIGWQPVTCAGDDVNIVVGTTGQSLRMEALDISVSTGTVCADAHVQNIGWQGQVCAAAPSFAMVGTTGQSLRMEAVTLTV